MVVQNHMDNNIAERAAIFARHAHEGQKRKATGAPYFTHVGKVAEILSGYTERQELISAAYLHDTLEDCDVSYNELKAEFGNVIADYVFCLTNDKTVLEKSGKVSYMVSKISSMDSDVLLIKMCDTLANMLDYPSWESAQNYKKIWSMVKNNILSSRSGIWKGKHEELFQRILEAFDAATGV